MTEQDALRERLKAFMAEHMPNRRGRILDSKKGTYSYRNQEVLAKAIGISKRTLTTFLGGGPTADATADLVRKLLALHVIVRRMEQFVASGGTLREMAERTGVALSTLHHVLTKRPLLSDDLSADECKAITAFLDDDEPPPTLDASPEARRAALTSALAKEVGMDPDRLASFLELLSAA